MLSLLTSDQAVSLMTVTACLALAASVTGWAALATWRDHRTWRRETRRRGPLRRIPFV